jgi:hypothetical protein
VIKINVCGENEGAMVGKGTMDEVDDAELRVAKCREKPTVSAESLGTMIEGRGDDNDDNTSTVKVE